MTDSKYYTVGEGSRIILPDSDSFANIDDHMVSMAGLSYSDPAIDVRPSYHRLNYQEFRPGDSIPRKDGDIMRACRRAYEQVGIVRSVVDLMAEIAVEGLKLESTDPTTENFYKAWAKRVSLEDRAEKFANYFLVEGNVVIRRKMAEIDTPTIRRMRRTKTLGQELDREDIFVEPGLVPIEYIFYCPSSIALIGGELAMFTGVKQYGIIVNNRMLVEMAQVPEKDRNRLMAALPEEIRELIRRGGSGQYAGHGNIVIPIPTNRVYVSHNRKCDSQVWAKSFIYSILHDVIYNEKLRLAKMSALDGWHNAIRLWKLGDHTNEILPEASVFSKLANILKQHPGGVLDILWDSMIDMEDYYPPIEKLQSFDENYESMMLGLGVPRLLIGGSENSGVTNFAVGMKNLMKRVEGVRRNIIAWVETEIETISKNTGVRNRPVVKFSYQDLFDNQTYWRILVDMYDRQLISDESVLDKLGEYFEIERSKAKREHDLREGGELAPRNGPFLQARIPRENQQFQFKQQDNQFKQQLKQQKQQQSKPPSEEDKQKNDRDGGRPPGSRDSFRRVRRVRSLSELITLAERIQDKIDKLVDKEYLQSCGVKNKRQLNSTQKEELERAKLQMMACVEDDSFETIADLYDKVNNHDGARLNQFISRFDDEMKSSDQSLTSPQIRMIKNYIFAEVES